MSQQTHFALFYSFAVYIDILFFPSVNSTRNENKTLISKNEDKNRKNNFRKPIETKNVNKNYLSQNRCQ